MIRRAPLRRTGRLKAISKRRRASQKFTKSDPVYQAVDRRSGGRCEVVLDGIRCAKRQSDRHHLRPGGAGRNSLEGHTPHVVLAVCRNHHDLAHARRLAIVANGDGMFACRLADFS